MLEMKDTKEKIVQYQKDLLLDKDSRRIWSHGFICGLYDKELISNAQLIELTNWIK